MNLPTRDEIKVWIKTSTPGRQWLADECGVVKTTIDQWLSNKNIPIAQHHRIAELMKESSMDDSETSLIRVPFSDDLLEKAHQAASIVSTEFQDFCSRAIQHRAEEIIAGATRPAGKVYQMPTISGRVAEPDIIKADEPDGMDES